MIKIIVVEGVDNTGKTRLIKRLVQSFPLLKVIKSPGPTPDLPRWTMQELMESRNRHLKIYDRFFFSELVYGPVLRGKNLYSEKEQNYILDFMKLVAQPLVILCYRLNAEESISEREQMEGVIENFEQLSQGYFEVIEPLLMEYEIPYIPYSFEDEGAFERVKLRVAKHMWKE